MDKIWRIFLQFNLYMSHKFGSGKHDFIPYLCVLRLSKTLKRKFKKWNFGHFFQLIFSIWLIRGSTYTRVYTVIRIQFLEINNSNYYILRRLIVCTGISNILHERQSSTTGMHTVLLWSQFWNGADIQFWNYKFALGQPGPDNLF